MAPPAPLRLSPGTTRPTAVAGLQALGTSAVLGVLVLFALDDLGLGAPSFGVLLGALAAGATLGGLVAEAFGVAVAVAVAGGVPAVLAALLAMSLDQRTKTSGPNTGKRLTAADKHGAVAGTRTRGGARVDD